MNIIVADLPQVLSVGGRDYEINYDFQFGLYVMLAFESNELTQSEKLEAMLENIYPEVPDDIPAATEMAMWFLCGGEKVTDEGKPSDFSFTKDDKLIYSAFRKVFGVDLNQTELHWWTFRSMFIDLFGEDTAFGGLVHLRQRVRTNKATKEERAAAAEMGDLFDVPEVDDRPLEQKEQEQKFLDLVKKGREQKAAARDGVVEVKSDG